MDEGDERTRGTRMRGSMRRRWEEMGGGGRRWEAGVGGVLFILFDLIMHQPNRGRGESTGKFSLRVSLFSSLGSRRLLLSS